MSDHKLILYPKDPHAPAVEREQIEEPLRTAGFIGKPIEVVGEMRYRPGSRFEKLLPFSGPSEPAHCTIEIPEAKNDVEFLGGANVEAPSCRSCGFNIEQWADAVSAWFDDRETFVASCPACGSKAKLWELDWHHTNAFGRYSVDVWNVDLGDATPSENLLHILANTNGGEWDYFYYVL
ncbi:MAG TPA: hypothetical protein VGK31_10295 [Thermoanaerobaculia bacterium]